MLLPSFLSMNKWHCSVLECLIFKNCCVSCWLDLFKKKRGGTHSVDFGLRLRQNFQEFLNSPQTSSCHLVLHYLGYGAFSAVRIIKPNCRSVLKNIEYVLLTGILNIQPKVNSLCKIEHIYLLIIQICFFFDIWELYTYINFMIYYQ